MVAESWEAEEDTEWARRRPGVTEESRLNFEEIRFKNKAISGMKEASGTMLSDGEGKRHVVELKIEVEGWLTLFVGGRETKRVKKRNKETWEERKLRRRPGEPFLLP